MTQHLPSIASAMVNIIDVLGPVLGIAISIIAGLYFSAYILRNEKMKEKAVSMLWDIVIFFVVLIFLSDQLLIIASSIAKDLNNAGYNAYCLTAVGIVDIDKYCHILIARGYLNTLVSEGLSFFESVFASYRITKLAESMQIISKSANQELTKSVGKTASAYNYAIETYMGYMQTIIIVSLMQLYFFDFFVKLFPLLFSVGIILRAMPLTKKTGGLLISIALCTFIFMPLVISIVDIFYENIPQSKFSGFRLNRVHNPLFGLGAILQFDLVDPNTGNVVPSTGIVPTQIINPGSSSVQTINPGTYSVNINTGPITNVYNNMPTQATQGQINTGLSPSIQEKILDNIEAFIKLIPFLSSISPVFGVYAGQVTAKFIASTAGGVIAGPLGSILGDFFGSIVGYSAGAAISATFIISGFAIVNYTIFSLAEILSNFVVFSAMFAYITLISTIGAIKALSEFLGGEIEIAGITSFL